MQLSASGPYSHPLFRLLKASLGAQCVADGAAFVIDAHTGMPRAAFAPFAPPTDIVRVASETHQHGH